MLAAMHVTLEIPRDNDGGNFDLIGKQLFFSHGVGYFEIAPSPQYDRPTSPTKRNPGEVSGV
jgi:hypothetical protein